MLLTPVSLLQLLQEGDRPSKYDATISVSSVRVEERGVSQAMGLLQPQLETRHNSRGSYTSTIYESNCTKVH